MSLYVMKAVFKKNTAPASIFTVVTMEAVLDHRIYLALVKIHRIRNSLIER